METTFGPDLYRCAGCGAKAVLHCCSDVVELQPGELPLCAPDTPHGPWMPHISEYRIEPPWTIEEFEALMRAADLDARDREALIRMQAERVAWAKDCDLGTAIMHVSVMVDKIVNP